VADHLEAVKKSNQVPKPETPIPESITVDCLTCHERIGVLLAEESQTISCTFCDAPIAVPSRGHVRSIQLEKARKSGPPVGEYAVAKFEDSPAENSPAAGNLRTGGSKKKKGAALTITVECATCHELMRVNVGQEPGRTACTFCQAVVPIPDRRTVAGWEREKIAPRPAAEIGAYDHGEIPKTVPLRPGNVFDRMAEVRQEAPPPPPRWTFFSGVFTIPWQGETCVRWVYMSLGLMGVLGLLAVLRFVAAAAAPIAAVVGAFFLLPIIWLSFFSFSYLASCCLHVFESTSAGLERVDTWPEPSWREWMADMMSIAWIGAIPLGASYGIALLGQEFWGSSPWLATPLLFFVFYPISFLSALEANTVWVPLTRPILASVARWWWCWLMFYFLAGGVTALTTAAAGYLLSNSYHSAVIALGPIIPAFGLIYFRLLGRLAWRMTAKLKKIRATVERPGQ
jgi:hypothetical protein